MKIRAPRRACLSVRSVCAVSIFLFFNSALRADVVSFQAVGTEQILDGSCVTPSPIGGQICDVTMNVPGFDPEMGVLTGVEIDDALNTAGVIAPLYGPYGPISGGYDAEFNVYGVVSSTQFISLLTLTTETPFSSPGPPAFFAASATGSAVLPPLAFFDPAGDIELEGVYADSADCNCGEYGWDGNYTDDLTITYTYTPTPEPSALLLLSTVVGAIGLKFAHDRRKARKKVGSEMSVPVPQLTLFTSWSCVRRAREYPA
jgi:hypothetical protein